MGRPQREPSWCGLSRLAALVAVFGVAASWADEKQAGLKQGVLNVGFTQAAFLHMNRNNVEAAFKVLALTVGRNRGYALESNNQVFEDATALKQEVEHGRINMVVFDTWTYLSKDFDDLVAPVFVGSERDGVGKRFVVLTRKDSGLNSLVDLRGEGIAELEVASATMGHFWLETLLLKKQFGTHKTFFSRTDSVGKASSAVLPVFFGRIRACLVDLPGFNVMNELNPQVGNRLQTIESSPLLVDAVVCLSYSGWTSDDFKEDVIEALAELHIEPEGQQILTLFKADRLIRFQSKFLDTARELRTAYDDLHPDGIP